EIDAMSMLSRIDRARGARRHKLSHRDRVSMERRLLLTPESQWLLKGRRPLSVYTVTDPNDDDSSGTLRSIVEQLNSDSTPDTINFNLAGSAPFVIQLTSALLQIANSDVIDGTSQPSHAGQPSVELNANHAGGGNGFQLDIGNVTIEGLIIDQWN